MQDAGKTCGQAARARTHAGRRLANWGISAVLLMTTGCGVLFNNRESATHKRTIAHEALALEATVLPVAPSIKKELDVIIERVVRRVQGAEPKLKALDPLERGRTVLQLIEDQLKADHFVYPGRGYVSTLRDALTPTMLDALGVQQLLARKENKNRHADIIANSKSVFHIADCDTYSILYLAIGERLHLPISMIDLPSTPNAPGHNHIVWLLPDGSGIPWEAVSGEWRTSWMGNLPFFSSAPRTEAASAAAGLYGVPMTRTEVLGAWNRLVGGLWLKLGAPSKAADAFAMAVQLNPRSPDAYNELAWLLATSPDPTVRDPARAIRFGEKAVALWPSESYVDTLAAAYAAAGQWNEAKKKQADAILIAKKSGAQATDLQRRLEMYEHLQVFLAPRSDEYFAEVWRKSLQDPDWRNLAIAVDGNSTSSPVQDNCPPANSRVSDKPIQPQP